MRSFSPRDSCWSSKVCSSRSLKFWLMGGPVEAVWGGCFHYQSAAAGGQGHFWSAVLLHRFGCGGAALRGRKTGAGKKESGAKAPHSKLLRRLAALDPADLLDPARVPAALELGLQPDAD